METQTETLNKADDGALWRVRLTVLWRDEVLPVPISPESRQAAADSGIQLTTRPGSCVAHFAVSAKNCRDALPGALDHWEAVVSEAGLPNWEVVSIAIDQTDDLQLDLIF